MGRMLDALKQLETQTESSPAVKPPDNPARPAPAPKAAPSTAAPQERQGVALTMPLRSVAERVTGESKNTPPPIASKRVAAPTGSAPKADNHAEPAPQQAAAAESAERLNNRFETTPAAPRSASRATPLEQQLRLALSDPLFAPRLDELVGAINQQMQGVANPVITVAALETGDAATDTLGRLAVRLAEQDAGDVLLVDANLGEARLSRALDIAAKAGLIEVFNLRKTWREFALPTSFPRLSVLPAGRGVLTSRQSAERLIGDLVSQFKSSYRYTLVDAGSVRSPLAGCAARHCDACYLQVRIGATSVRRAAPAVHELRALGARVLGCIAAGAESP